jgi:Domain of unknown function (DUF4372)
MYKVCSIFSQVLKLFSRGDFEKAVKEHKAERHARGFTRGSQRHLADVGNGFDGGTGTLGAFVI